MAVKSTPEGMRTVTPHLIVSDAAKALEFYKKVFGAEERSRMLGPDGKVMHADLQLGDSHVFLSDPMPGAPVVPAGIVIHVYTDNPDAIFERAVKAGATVRMPLTDMFWGDRYGQLVDPFGQSWSLAKHLEDLTPEQTKKRAEEFFKTMAANNCGG